MWWFPDQSREAKHDAAPVRAERRVAGGERVAGRRALAVCKQKRGLGVQMREFHGEAAQVVAAPLEDCLALVAAVDSYPEWCPEIVRDAHVLDRDAAGQPTRVRMTMHVARGVLVREFALLLAIVVEPPEIVKLTRFTDHPTEQQFNALWVLRAADSTRVALKLDAKLRVPSYVPAGGVGDSIAEGFVGAACRRLAGQSP